MSTLEIFIVVTIFLLIFMGSYFTSLTKKNKNFMSRHRTRKGFFNSMSREDKIAFLEGEKARLRKILVSPVYGESRDEISSSIKDIDAELKRLKKQS